MDISNFLKKLWLFRILKIKLWLFREKFLFCSGITIMVISRINYIFFEKHAI